MTAANRQDFRAPVNPKRTSVARSCWKAVSVAFKLLQETTKEADC
jgi:hypothetical protein